MKDVKFEIVYIQIILYLNLFGDRFKVCPRYRKNSGKIYGKLQTGFTGTPQSL